MSATEDAEFYDIQSLRTLLTFQEPSFVDPFGQDLDLDSAGLEKWLPHGDNNVQYEMCTAEEGGDTSKLTRKCKSNPFYSPPREIRRLVEKGKNNREIGKVTGENIKKDLQDVGQYSSDTPKKIPRNS